MSTQQRLMARYLNHVPLGKLEWIGLRPARRQEMQVVEQCRAIAELGLEGDRRCEAQPGSARQVSIISTEYLQVIGQYLGGREIDPALLRRNLLVSGINLHALRHQRFAIGEAVFEGTSHCHPCSRMEEALGEGGLVAMLGHGGICAKILQTGLIKAGDVVRYLPLQPSLPL